MAKDAEKGVNFAISEAAKEAGPFLDKLGNDVLDGVKDVYFISANEVTKAAKAAQDGFKLAVAVLEEGINAGLALVVRIGEQVYTSAVQSLQEAARAIEGVISAVIEAIEKAIDFLKELFLGTIRKVFGNARKIKS